MWRQRRVQFKLAKYFVDHGAEVDFRRSHLYLTALHHAARQNSAAAAEMMKYLLLQGANPELMAGRARLRIRDEKGAKGIAQWLGMSWDELVAKAKEEREKIA
jgi:ankyrin repeat protein